jgi:hypothetical protein
MPGPASKAGSASQFIQQKLNHLKLLGDADSSTNLASKETIINAQQGAEVADERPHQNKAWEDKNRFASAKIELAKRGTSSRRGIPGPEEEEHCKPGVVSRALVDRLAVSTMAHHLASAVDIGNPRRRAIKCTDGCGGTFKRNVNTGRGRMSQSIDRCAMQIPSSPAPSTPPPPLLHLLHLICHHFPHCLPACMPRPAWHDIFADKRATTYRFVFGRLKFSAATIELEMRSKRSIPSCYDVVTEVLAPLSRVPVILSLTRSECVCVWPPPLQVGRSMREQREISKALHQADGDVLLPPPPPQDGARDSLPRNWEAMACLSNSRHTLERFHSMFPDSYR